MNEPKFTLTKAQDSSQTPSETQPQADGITQEVRRVDSVTFRRVEEEDITSSASAPVQEARFDMEAKLFDVAPPSQPAPQQTEAETTQPTREADASQTLDSVMEEVELEPEDEVELADDPSEAVVAQQQEEPITESEAPGRNALPSHEITELVNQHELWISSQGAQGKRASFRDAIIVDFDFSQKVLAGANFKGATLHRCRFTQAQLNEADYSEVKAREVDFTAAQLSNAILSAATLSHTSFSAAQLQKADLSQAHLEHANFTQVVATEANFRDAVMNQADMRASQLNLANFRDAQLVQTSFKNADLTQTIFRGADVSSALFDDANLLQTQFKDAVMHHVDMSVADFSQALDVSWEAQVEAMQLEREKIAKEAANLESIRDQLEHRERQLIAEREQLQKQLQLEKNKTTETPIPEKNDVDRLFRRSARLFVVLGVLWFVIAFVLSIVVQAALSQLDSTSMGLFELAMTAILIIGPFVLFVVGMAKSFSLSYQLEKLLK